MSAVAGHLDVLAGWAAHKGCGGGVEPGGRPGGGAAWAQCGACKRWWFDYELANMGDAELDAAFELCPGFEPHALVWVPDPVTGRRHTRLLPVHEAAGLERVRIP